MHEAYWGLSEPPFALTPDPRFYYIAREQENALMMLHYALAGNKGAILLTGSLGSGKTSLCHKLVALTNADRTTTVTLGNPDLTATQLRKEILIHLGVSAASSDPHVVANELRVALRGMHQLNKKVLLILDDAHQIQSDGVFEEVLALHSLQVDERSVLSILLCGQHPLVQNLTKFPALDQAITIRERIKPLTIDETASMLNHRLHTAGYAGDQDLFGIDAVHELHRSTQGVPRVICNVANHALILGMLKTASHVDGLMMRAAIDEFFGGVAA